MCGTFCMCAATFTLDGPRVLGSSCLATGAAVGWTVTKDRTPYRRHEKIINEGSFWMKHHCPLLSTYQQTALLPLKLDCTYCLECPVYHICTISVGKYSQNIPLLGLRFWSMKTFSSPLVSIRPACKREQLNILQKPQNWRRVQLNKHTVEATFGWCLIYEGSPQWVVQVWFGRVFMLDGCPSWFSGTVSPSRT